MKSYLINIPLKKTEEVSWVKPLNSYLLSIYGNTSDHQEDINAFDKLRQDIRGVNADPTGIRFYCKYYSQLELLDLRISFLAVNKIKKTNFVWYDVFDTTVSHKQNALPFEKANVLFNLGALLSKAGSLKYNQAHKAEGEDTTKEAILLLQQSAGIFQFLNENFLHAPSVDLGQGTVRFFVKLMLAQSQEVFVLKVISGDLEQKKNSLIAKLCRSTSNHYEACFDMVSHLADPDYENSQYAVVDDDDEDFLDNPSVVEDDSSFKVNAKVETSWVAIVHLKYIYYKSLAFYFNGLHLEATRKYGEALAYLTKSAQLLEDVSSESLKLISKTSESYELLENYKYQKDAVGIKLKDLTKDNELIYHDLIPSLVTLPDIKPMDSAKVIPINENTVFQEINDKNYSSFLNNVIPINIHELLSFYSEEKSQFLRNELDLVDVSNEELASVLEYFKLPHALVALKELFAGSDNLSSSTGGIEIGSDIKQISDQVASKFQDDKQNRDKIQSLRKQIFDTFSESDAILSRQVSEASLRFKDDLIKLKKSLYDATNNDTKLFGLIDGGNQLLYEVLGRGSRSAEFQQLFQVQTGTPRTSAPEISLLDIDDSISNTPGDINGQIKKVEDILHDLNVIRLNKIKLIEALKKEIHEEDISDILILNSKVKSSSEIKSVIFPQELKKFEPYNEELDKLIEKQKVFIGDLRREWEAVNANPEIKNIQTSKQFKDQVLADQSGRIKELYEVWQKYTVGLGRGVEFYTQLHNFSLGLKQRIAQASGTPASSRPSLNDSFSSLGLDPTRSNSYTRPAPQLPPKSGSRSGSIPGSIPGSYTGYQATPAPPPGPNTVPGGDGRAKPPAPSSDLIYDQPSTYQPNMYNFFSNN